MQRDSNNKSGAKPVLHIGSVSYLNAKPLIEGLDRQADLQLHLAVPAKLIDGLRLGGENASRQSPDPGGTGLDVALLPVIDYQRLENLRVVPSGGIGCEGPTLTVRIFSSVPIERITSLACDIESHTSVALARVILAERYGIAPEFVELPRGKAGAAAGDVKSDARLLIGDKVVCEEPKDLHHQLDLGQAWNELTGLPFVFAIWTARPGVDLRDLPQRLVAARELGLSHVGPIIECFAVPHGWPADLARQYLTQYLKYPIGQRELEAMRFFHSLAAKHGLISSPPKVLSIYQSA